MIRLFYAAILSLIAVSAQAQIDIQEVTSPDGHDAWLVEDHQIPFVALDLIFDGGASLDLSGKRGATSLMVALLEEGAGEMDARSFQTAREALAASFTFRAYDDSVTVSAVFLTENRDEAMALLRAALVAPRFDGDAVERVRGQIESVIRSDANDPRSIASAAFNAAAFGDHPYGSVRDGTLDTVAGLTRDDIVTAHQNALVSSRVHVGAAGDITAAELGALVDDLLSELPAQGPARPAPVSFGLEGGTTVVPFDTPQSVVRFGHAGMHRDHEDFFAAYLVNQILGGGGLESRLMREVREKRGLTYGVYSYLVNRDFTDVFMGSVSSSNDRVAEAIAVIQEEWSKMAEAGITADELHRAKTYITGSYPLRFDGNGDIAGILAGMQAIGLTPDYVTHRNDYVNAVTLEDANRVAAELLDPEGLHFVVVGQSVGLD